MWIFLRNFLLNLSTSLTLAPKSHYRAKLTNLALGNLAIARQCDYG